MELVKVKRYAELIDEFARQADEPLEVESKSSEDKATSEKKKKDVIEIIEYFSNMLVKYFYSEDQDNEISILNSGFDYEQLWLFIECLIKEKKLENLLSFFEKYEREVVDSELGSATQGEDSSNEEEDSTGETGQRKRTLNRVKMKVRGASSKKRKVKFSEEGCELNDATSLSVENREVDQKGGDASGEDKFFDEDEMHQFLDEEEKKMLRGQSGRSSDEGDSDGNEVGDDVDLNEFDCDYEEGRKLKYDDFYRGGSDNDDDEDDYDDEEEEDDDEDDVDEEEEEDEYNDEDDEDEDDLDDEDDGNDDNDDDEVDVEDDEETGSSEGGEPRERRGPEQRSRKEKDEEIERELQEINQFDSLHRGEDDDSTNGDGANGDGATEDEEDNSKMDKEKIEKELIEKKHWSLTGEVFAHDRPKNSLLNLNVDIPKLSSGGNDAYVSKTVGEEDDEQSDENAEEGGIFNEGAFGTDGTETHKGGKKLLSKSKRRNLLNDEIEMVVKQRIQNMLFDDVEKKRIEDLDLLMNESKERDGKEDEVNFDHLNFNKSKLSLADEYTKKYEEEIKNNPSEKKEINLQKLELMNLYKKIIHFCDSLCNDYYLPKPTLLNPSNKNEKFSNLHIEETIPIILSEKDRSAPEQLFQPGHIKQLEEMHQKEKKSIRKSNKVKRKKKLLHLFGQSGKGINELKKRNEYLSGKNKKIKGEKESAAKYGVGSKDQLSGKGRSRYDFAGAISQAQARDKRGQGGMRQKG
ncbi:U3 small nucleolar ribonucleoprotein protein MPP10, putative [Plasmodium knowlesi strain H]|uniref:U3 small nucleolar ribonucleoprotein protein MPP10, putative n=3 Tax=Plasmodium knowlesi TaxID=5850 RepID=A0A5K1VN97_PLAKH|nr:U3 small nucleolar ribonucleoprotein MPP10, putative [Plasmodium knowlesi strain H]OTN68216.1 putative U3 small nucleolar ribonucleoprotein MPP10 [Plasmodium knowlesi]CAA9987165.1 U3 small nucleolar ribonucleoprotein protein MPP10, putative [Plasmodium knowlesi strain H]SBO23922.1 U3 small nucleolar ribonucleoprotein protein MPP10, putative [Plasmodium knowlesi strain H]SBO25825.1 U3 small nucleolar ribonucleoprotein protein MPP10, putative [Plasmodium knowlesi strain H]VVS76639.1 U3 small |eukprot:XP_002261789.1 hypothetical protein, conserved in Plasmodium species [Plasmodium knowlesi strain H]